MQRDLSQTKKIGLLVVIILAALLPFINKAYHIDDTLVLYPVRQILKSPLHPFDFDVNWYGFSQSIWELTNPPFIFYYLAPIVFVFGEKEIWFHIAYLIFPIMAGISMYFLGKRFTGTPFISALLLIATPAFLVSATSIMPDIPFLSLYLSAVVLYIYGTDKNNKSLMVFAGILIGFACLTKYTGLSLIPLLLLYSLLKKKGGAQAAIALGLGFVLFSLWCLYSKVSYGYLQPVEVCQYFDFRKELLLSKTLGTLSYMGGGTIFSLLFFLLCKKGKDMLVYFLSLLLTILLSLKSLLAFQYTVPQIILFVFFASLGLFFCIISIKGIFPQNRRSEDKIFLLLWFFGILFFDIIIEFAAVRYVLILVPPMILLLMEEIEWTLKLRKVLSWGIVLTLWLGLLVSYGDYIYANYYRDFALNKTVKLRKEGKVWFRGHWGFQYYMEREGFQPLANDQIINKGDLIIIPVIATYILLPQKIEERMELVDTIVYQSSFPVRTMQKQQKAGFYSHGWGFLPYVLTDGYLERFEIYKIKD